ncbi:MAG: hypothetical protein ACFFAX_04970 [Promethearchaeota archaeon]
MVRSIGEVMQFLENYTLAWHHWLMLLSLLKLGGSGTKSQILPVYRREGFSPHAIHKVFQTDLVDLGEAIEVEGGIESLTNKSTIHLTEDPTFRAFLKKHVKPVLKTLKTKTQN